MQTLALLALASPVAPQLPVDFDAATLVATELERIDLLDDLDLDGDLDLVGIYRQNRSGTSVRLSAWENTGDGTFPKLWDRSVSIPWPLVGGIEGLGAGDLDGDGDEDFFAWLGGQVRILRNNGVAPPTVASPSTSARHCSRPCPPT